MAVSPRLVVIVFTCNLWEGIEFNVAAGIGTIPLRHDETQVAVRSTQVERLTQRGSIDVGERCLDVTDVSPVLCIVAAHDVHAFNVTVRCITASYLYLNHAGNGFIKGNLQIRSGKHILMIVAVPISAGHAINQIFQFVTLGSVERVT